MKRFMDFILSIFRPLNLSEPDVDERCEEAREEVRQALRDVRAAIETRLYENGHET